MTIAGSNIRVDIWRTSTVVGDDYVGGAVVTGSVVYSYIPARMQGQPPEQLVMQQGLETVHTFRMTLIPGTLDIREADEVQIVAPVDHQLYHDKFTVDGVRYADFTPRDPRNYMILELSRSVRAHSGA